MPTYEFTVALDRAPADDDFDRLFDAGLDDTTPETRDGHGVLNVARDAATISAAIASVVRDIERAGFRAVGIEDDDLVSLKTVAQRTGRSYESLRLLASGKRGPGGFPEPLSGDGWALYSWTLVADWYSRNYGADELPAVTDDQRVLAAASLMLRAVETAGPAVSDLLAIVSHTVVPRVASIRTAMQHTSDALAGVTVETLGRPAARAWTTALHDAAALPGFVESTEALRACTQAVAVPGFVPGVVHTFVGTSGVGELWHDDELHGPTPSESHAGAHRARS